MSFLISKYINSSEDADIALYKNLHFTPVSHIETNVCIAEGSKTVRKLLKSEIAIKSILCTEKYIDELQFYGDRLSEAKVLIAPKLLIDEIAGFKLHEGIMAIGAIPDGTPLELLGKQILALHGIVNSENVGAIVRNAAAFGFDSIIYDSKTSSPYLRRAVRASMGSIFFEKVYKSVDILNDLSKLKANGYQIVSIELSDGAIDINKANISDKVCFIFGAESNGISKEILELSDIIAKIPINKQADSLNVAACSAIVLNQYRAANAD